MVENLISFNRFFLFKFFFSTCDNITFKLEHYVTTWNLFECSFQLRVSYLLHGQQFNLGYVKYLGLGQGLLKIFHMDFPIIDFI